MGIFDVFKKKNCDLCGGEIGLLGNRKLENGNCCKHCAAKLSRWFDDRRNSTVEQIRNQLEYRTENAEALKSFHTTKVIGEENWVYIDEASRRFFVARREDYLSENPDILTFDQVTECKLDIDEDKEEIMREVTDNEGNTKKVSYSPKRFLYRYDFNMIIRVQHPFFDDMCFRLNNCQLELESNGTRGLNKYVNFSAPGIDPTRDINYRNYVSMGEEIISLLTSPPAAAPTTPPVTNTPKFCPNCGTPASGSKFCPECGERFVGNT